MSGAGSYYKNFCLFTGVLFILLLSTITAFADHSTDRYVRRPDLINPVRPHPYPGPIGPMPGFRFERKVQRLVQSIESKVSIESKYLSMSEKREVLMKLREVNQILKGVNVIDPIGPIGPIGPGPVRPPVYNKVVCSHEHFDLMSVTLKKVKAFAYSGSGLNMSSTQSTHWAQDWLAKYPCDVADEFISEFKKIKYVAYSGSGFNMSSTQSVNYALDITENKTCMINDDYMEQAKKYYRFAYSGSGLNMSSREASNYSKQMVEDEFFNCGGVQSVAGSIGYSSWN
jgi:hypothetical protein